MNTSSNATHHGENGTCLKEDTILLAFTLWAIMDKLLVLATNGGTIIIIYIHRYAMLEIPSNIFIGCLTMADLLSVVALPFKIASTYLPHTWGWNVSCFLAVYISYTTSMVNTVTLCVIAVDRMIYVVYPLQYHIKMSVNRAFVISITIWVFCSLYSVLFIGLSYIDAYDVGIIARPCHTSISTKGFISRFLQYPFLIFVPVTIGSYIKVGMVALKQRNMITAAGTCGSAQPAGMDFKITKVMLNVLSLYLLCTLVVVVIPPLRSYMFKQKETCGVVLRVAYCIWHTNTWLNPIIYAWKSQKFRRYVRGVLNRNQVDSSDFNLI